MVPFVLAPAGGIWIPKAKIIIRTLIYIKYNLTIFIISLFKPFLGSKTFFVYYTDNMVLIHEIWTSFCHNFWRKGPFEMGIGPKCAYEQAECKYKRDFQKWHSESLQCSKNHHFTIELKLIFGKSCFGSIWWNLNSKGKNNNQNINLYQI